MDTDTGIQPNEAVNTASDGISSSSDHHGHGSMLAFVRDLLEMENNQVNLERSGGRLRLRFRTAGAGTGRMNRNALELPDDEKLAAEIAELIRSRRQTRRDAKIASRSTQDGQQWRKAVRRRLVAACRHGRVVRRRLALVLDLALLLGACFVTDFLRRRPWNAQSPFHAGRRSKRS